MRCIVTNIDKLSPRGLHDSRGVHILLPPGKSHNNVDLTPQAIRSYSGLGVFDISPDQKAWDAHINAQAKAATPPAPKAAASPAPVETHFVTEEVPTTRRKSRIPKTSRTGRRILKPRQAAVE